MKFNAANPLKMSRVVNIKGEKPVPIHFNYERIQKRCFICHRLNHEQRISPLVVKRRKDEALVRRQRISKELEVKQTV